MKVVVLFVILVTVVSSQAPAHSDSLVTDRPDFVEAAAAVGARRIQVETSIGLTRADGEEFALPTLLRIGVLESLEVRLETEGPVLQAQTRKTTFVLPEVGLKWHAADNTGAVPGVALLLHDQLSDSGLLQPSLRAVFEWELPAAFGLGIMPGVACAGSAKRDTACTGLLGVVAGYALSDFLRVFVESANEDWTLRQVGVSTLDTGLAYLLTPDMQIDTAAYVGLTNAAPALGLTVGFSFRY